MPFLAVLHAMYHDGSSGGVVRIGVITKSGIERHIFYAPIEQTEAEKAAGVQPVVVSAQ